MPEQRLISRTNKKITDDVLWQLESFLKRHFYSKKVAFKTIAEHPYRLEGIPGLARIRKACVNNPNALRALENKLHAEEKNPRKIKTVAEYFKLLEAFENIIPPVDGWEKIRNEVTLHRYAFNLHTYSHACVHNTDKLDRYLTSLQKTLKDIDSEKDKPLLELINLVLELPDKKQEHNALWGKEGLYRLIIFIMDLPADAFKKFLETTRSLDLLQIKKEKGYQEALMVWWSHSYELQHGDSTHLRRVVSLINTHRLCYSAFFQTKKEFTTASEHDKRGLFEQAALDYMRAKRIYTRLRMQEEVNEADGAWASIYRQVTGTGWKRELMDKLTKKIAVSKFRAHRLTKSTRSRSSLFNSGASFA